MSTLPTNIRAEVSALLAQKPDAQRYVYLLAARLKRDRVLPEDKRIVNPIMWLRRVLQLPSQDFSEADRFAEEQAAHATHRLQMADQQATKLASQQAQAEERAHRHARAERLLDEYSNDDRAALIAAVSSNALPKRTIESIRDAVDQGVLPEHPFALNSLLLAIERMSPAGTAGTQEQSA